MPPRRLAVAVLFCLALLATLPLGGAWQASARATVPVGRGEAEGGGERLSAGLRPTPSAVAGPEELTEALEGALEACVARQAEGARLRLGEVHRLDAWAYAVADYLGADGQPLGGRFVAFLGHHEPGSGWRFVAPGLSTPREYNALLALFPSELLDEGTRAYLRLRAPAAIQATVVGHRLPWPAGEYAYVTQIDVEPHHMHQVDFDILGLLRAGDVCASKAGEVVFVKQCSDSGACGFAGRGKGNLVVIRHGPAEYSWYLHLAYNSVPVRVGDWVEAGTKIGVEGETGNACGVHLHYMVTRDHTPWTNPEDPNVEPWATEFVAVDFAEAPWSSLVVMQTYVSANAAPPPELTERVYLPLVVAGTPASMAGEGYEATDYTD